MSAEAPTNAESRTTPATRSPTPELGERKMGMGKWEPCTCQPEQPNCPACTGAEHPCLLCERPPQEQTCPMCGSLSEEEAPPTCSAPFDNHPAKCLTCGAVDWLDGLRACSVACSDEQERLIAELVPATWKDEGSFDVSDSAGKASCDHRSELKAQHLRWDPTAEWSGVVLGSDIAALEGLGLTVEVRDGPAPPVGSSRGGAPLPPEPLRSRRALGASIPSRRRDHSRTSAEAYFPQGERESLGRPSRFTLLDITSGLPDDTREDDQRARAKVEVERKGRVAAALAALEAHPAAQAQVYHDQTKLRLFCARFSITPSDICPMSESVTERCSWCRGRHGVFTPIHVDDVSEVLSSPADWLAEVRAREVAVLPGSDSSWD